MSNNIYKKFIIDNQKKFESWFKNGNKDVYDYIINTTNYLSSDSPFKHRIACIVNDLKPKSCEVCGNQTKLNYQKREFRNFCSYKCSNKHISNSEETKGKIKKTKLEKYGDENYCNVEKGLDTKYKKYGVKGFCNPEKGLQTKRENGTNSSSIVVIEKCKKTKLEKYGDENYVNPQKGKKTKLEKYGDENYCNVEKISKTKLKIYGSSGFCNPEKGLKTKREKYGNVWDVLSKDVLLDLHNEKKLTLTEISLMYGISDTQVSKMMREYDLDVVRFPRSVGEKILGNILDEFGIQYITNDRKVLAGKELDLYIPDFGVAIEHNGAYWHSRKEMNYHKDKYLSCVVKGITLLQFWDYEVQEKYDIVKNIIRQKLGLDSSYISARSCIIKNIDSKTKNGFLNRYHIQGGCNSDTNYGLFYNNELVSVMCFLRNELVRFASSVRVNGGASKLLTKFARCSNFDEITSFSDNMISNGELYITLGFDKVSDVRPTYKYIYKNGVYHRSSFMKRRFESDENLFFDPNMTEEKLAEINGLKRFYDAGKQKFVLQTYKYK